MLRPTWVFLLFMLGAAVVLLFALVGCVVSVVVVAELLRSRKLKQQQELSQQEALRWRREHGQAEEKSP